MVESKTIVTCSEELHVMKTQLKCRAVHRGMTKPIAEQSTEEWHSPLQNRCNTKCASSQCTTKLTNYLTHFQRHNSAKMNSLFLHHYNTEYNIFSAMLTARGLEIRGFPLTCEYLEPSLKFWGLTRRPQIAWGCCCAARFVTVDLLLIPTRGTGRQCVCITSRHHFKKLCATFIWKFPVIRDNFSNS